MIFTKSGELTGIHAGKRIITAVYHGATLVWESIEDVWRGLTAWRGTEPW